MIPSIGNKKDHLQKRKKIKRFHELQLSIESSMIKVKEMLGKQNTETRGVSRKAQDIIDEKEMVYNEIQSMINNWREMNSIYEAEVNKKKSRFTKIELETQHDILRKLNREIQSVNNVDVAGFGGVVGTGSSFQKNYSIHDPVISDEERRELDAIKEKDSEFDQKLDQIGNLLSNLNVLAEGHKDELKKQERVYEEVDQKVSETGWSMGKIQRKIHNTISRC